MCCVRESTVVRETPALLEMENEIDFEYPPPGGSIKIFFGLPLRGSSYLYILGTSLIY